MSKARWILRCRNRKRENRRAYIFHTDGVIVRMPARVYHAMQSQPEILAYLHGAVDEYRKTNRLS